MLALYVRGTMMAKLVWSMTIIIIINIIGKLVAKDGTCVGVFGREVISLLQ